MPRRKSEIGICRICGRNRKLSFEHVPPQKAFNSATVIEYKLSDVQDTRRAKGKLRQGGVGQHTLCESCNNDTGSWYGGEYVSWAEIGYEILHRQSNQYDGKVLPNMVAITMFSVYPLRFLKQVITCFFSVAGQAPSGAFASRNPGLASFVLDKRKKPLPSDIQIFMRLHDSEAIRRFPIGGTLRVIRDEKGNLHVDGGGVFSEIAHPPFAFGFSLAGSYPHSISITHFSEYGYDENADIDLALPIGRGALQYPGSR